MNQWICLCTSNDTVLFFFLFAPFRIVHDKLPAPPQIRIQIPSTPSNALPVINLEKSFSIASQEFRVGRFLLVTTFRRCFRTVSLTEALHALSMPSQWRNTAWILIVRMHLIKKLEIFLRKFRDRIEISIFNLGDESSQITSTSAVMMEGVLSYRFQRKMNREIIENARNEHSDSMPWKTSTKCSTNTHKYIHTHIDSTHLTQNPWPITFDPKSIHTKWHVHFIACDAIPANPNEVDCAIFLVFFFVSVRVIFSVRFECTSFYNKNKISFRLSCPQRTSCLVYALCYRFRVHFHSKPSFFSHFN